MNRRNLRRRPAFLALVIVALVGVVGAAFADSYEPVLPPFPDPRFVDPQLLVTPSDNLVSGQTVQVTGRRFGANATGGTLRQCTADLTLCESPRGSFTTGSNGEFNPINAPNTPTDPQTIPVPFVVQSTFVATNGTTVNCVVTPCVIFATVTSGGETRSAAHHISFQPEPTTTSSTSTSTTMAPTTTTTAPTASVCNQLRFTRATVNAQLDAVRAANPSFSAQIEAYRALVNARLDQELAARGCTTGA